MNKAGVWRRIFLILLIGLEVTALTFFALSGLWMWVFGIGGCFLSVGIFEVVSKLKYGKTMSSYLSNKLKEDGNKVNYKLLIGSTIALLIGTLGLVVTLSVGKIAIALGCFLAGMVMLVLHLVII